MFSSLLTVLALTIVLGLVHILLAGALTTHSRGVGWNVGNRDGEPAPVSVHAARAQRAAANFLETFPFFAAAVCAVLATSRLGWLAETGALIYFWARVAYLPIYIIGIPGLRSAAWATGLAGLLMVVLALF